MKRILSAALLTLPVLAMLGGVEVQTNASIPLGNQPIAIPAAEAPVATRLTHEDLCFCRIGYAA